MYTPGTEVITSVEEYRGYPRSFRQFREDGTLEYYRRSYDLTAHYASKTGLRLPKDRSLRLYATIENGTFAPGKTDEKNFDDMLAEIKAPHPHIEITDNARTQMLQLIKNFRKEVEQTTAPGGTSAPSPLPPVI